MRRDIAEHDTIKQAITGADAVIVATEWPEIIVLPPAEFKQAMRGDVIVDAVNRLDAESFRALSFVYLGVGR